MTDAASNTAADTESASDGRRWLSTADAAEMLGINPRTLYRLVDEGEVAAYRFGRVFRFTRGDLEEFIATSKVEPGSLSHLYHGDTTDGDTEADGDDDGR